MGECYQLMFGSCRGVYEFIETGTGLMESQLTLTQDKKLMLTEVFIFRE